MQMGFVIALAILLFAIFMGVKFKKLNYIRACTRVFWFFLLVHVVMTLVLTMVMNLDMQKLGFGNIAIADSILVLVSILIVNRDKKPMQNDAKNSA